ncbi:MAG TPA: CoA pyrophosphatase [Bacteroidia bacterium]|nr:CoA pyrophosphatase [Bacteroidia bacterium]
MNFAGFTDSLKNRLQNYPLPGQNAQYIMAGDNIRHKKIDLSALSNYKKSAVCLLFYEHDNNVYFALMKRPNTHQYHASQIALPGGSCDGDETYEQTAIRELHEETGVAITEENILGRLTPLYIPVSNFYIQPIVACINCKPLFQPSKDEVEELIEYKLKDILNENIVLETIVNLTTSGLKIKAPYFNVQGNVLWGATAMLLSEVKQLLIANKTIFSFLFQ